MNAVIRSICMLWISFIALVTSWVRSLKKRSYPPHNGSAVETSQSHEITDLRHAIVYGFRSAGRLCRCDIVPYRDPRGRFCCAILTPFGSRLPPRQVQQFAELVAREYFHKSPDSLTWLYIPCGISTQTLVPDEVWQIQFMSTGSNSDMQVAWSVAAPEDASAWSERIVLAADFGSLIDVHE